MPSEIRVVQPGSKPRTVVTQSGEKIEVPNDWELLPPGDAAATRRVKAGGAHWLVQVKKGRRTFSKGIWAPSDRIAKIQADLETERSTETYAKRRVADAKRREKKQADYVEDFSAAVFEFLNFDKRHQLTAKKLALLVTQHATPVGSGTVARTTRIPVEQRAESAVIAWMRHQTTAYDNMKIPRVKGKRRETRRLLAEQSRRLLEKYRKGQNVDPHECPLQIAIQKAA